MTPQQPLRTIPTGSDFTDCYGTRYLTVCDSLGKFYMVAVRKGEAVEAFYRHWPTFPTFEAQP
jgi:hypothetical protein